MTEYTSYKELLKSRIDELKLVETFDMTFRMNGKQAGDTAKILKELAEILDHRTSRRLHWTELAQRADVWSVYLSGMFVGFAMAIFFYDWLNYHFGTDILCK